MQEHGKHQKEKEMFSMTKYTSKNKLFINGRTELRKHLTPTLPTLCHSLGLGMH